jgi:hypothetical protein
VTTREQAQVISAKSRVDRIADRGLRESQRKVRGTVRRKPSRADVAAYKARIAALTEAHKIEFERVEWDEIVECGPVAPDISRDSESAAAKRALLEYRPSIIDNLLGREQQRRRELLQKVSEAARADIELLARGKAYAERHNKLLALAPDVRALKVEAIAGALKANGIVEALEHVVEGLSLTAPTPGRIVAMLDLPEFDAIPDEKCSVGAAGGTYSDIPMPDRCQLQLKCAASLVLRVAVEVLQVAPLEAVEVIGRQCRHDDHEGGDMETVLHAKVSLAALKKVQLMDADPAPALSAMGLRLDWSDARGLAPIEGESATPRARVAA